jgi:hypothetical protein
MNMIEQEEVLNILKGSSAGETIARRILSGQMVRESDFVSVANYEKVQPGDLITAEWMNKLLMRLARLELLFGHSRFADRGAAEFFTVFGEKLSDALEMIRKTGGHLQLGMVLDITGAEIKPTESGKISRRVLGQFLVPDERDGSTVVNLLVTSSTVGRFAGFGTEAKDIISEVAVNVINAQIEKGFGRNRTTNTSSTSANSADDAAKQRAAEASGTQTGHTLVMGRPTASAAGKQASASAKRQAGKKNARAGKKAASRAPDTTDDEK